MKTESRYGRLFTLPAEIIKRIRNLFARLLGISGQAPGRPEPGIQEGAHGLRSPGAGEEGRQGAELVRDPGRPPPEASRAGSRATSDRKDGLDPGGAPGGAQERQEEGGKSRVSPDAETSPKGSKQDYNSQKGKG